MKHRMEEQSLHTVVLADQDINWVKKDKEILVGDKLFDIEFIQHANGSTTFYGLYDEEETHLKSLFNENWKKNMAGQNKILIQFFQLLQGNFYDQPDAGVLVADKLPYIKTPASPKIINPFRSILTPPPQA